jgi:hypothetical protein
MKKDPLKRMRIPVKYLKIAGITLLILFILTSIAGVIAYNKREALLKVAIAKAVSKAKNDFNLDVKIGEASFEGIRTVNLRDVFVVPEKRDSLAYISELSVSVKLLPLLVGDIKLAALKLFDSKVSLVKRDSLRNYDFLFKKKNGDSSENSKRADLAEIADNLLSKLLNKIPDDMSMRNFNLTFTDTKDSLQFFVNSATIDDGDLKSTVTVNKNESVWHLNGLVEPGDKHLDLNMYAERKKVELAYIEKKFGLKLNFDTIHAQLKDVDRSGDQLKIYGAFSVKNLLINHPKLAANNIIVHQGSIDADVIIGENYISVDSSSVIHLKQIRANPFIKYTLYPTKTYELKIKTDEMDAQQVFNSFPRGMFESLEGLKVSGKLKYNLNFFLNSSNPDAVQFDSRLDKRNFRILGWGKTNLQKINSTFVYTPFEYGKPMRDITIGPGNPDYTPLNEISSLLKYAVLTAEDPSFYRHNGFVEESIRKSIATNYKEKAFKRGGSTISMQLVKNVFLNRQKTLTRKIEETLIVWLIEKNKLSTKERMFEVYLNLIEWGRNVYGIGEAARFYFDKHPSQLDLGESLFLARIVPMPKQGLRFFNGDGSLRTGVRGYFRLIGNLMAKRGWAERDTNAYGFYNVRLKPSLRTAMPEPDTTVIDSLGADEPEEDGPTLLERIFGGGKKPDTISIRDLEKQGEKKDSVLTPDDRRKQRREERRRKRKEGGGLFGVF